MTYRSFFAVRTSTLLLALAVFSVAPLAHAASVSLGSLWPTSGISAGTAVSFYAYASGFAKPTFSVSDSTGTNGAIDNSGFFSWTPTVNDAGTHVFTVTATDPNGVAASSTMTVYVVPSTIVIQNLLPGQTAYPHEPVTFTVSAPGFTSPTFLVADAYAGTSVSNANITSAGLFTWSPQTNEQGAHVLTITARDAYGRAAQAQETITVAPAALAIQNLSPGPAVSVGAPVTFSASTTGLTNPAFSIADSLGWYSTVNAGSVSSSTGAFSWTPAVTDLGTHVLTLAASDSTGGSASAQTTITVVKTAPAATAAPEQQASTAPAAGAVQDGYRFTSYLGIGSRGTAVTELQKHLTIDGSYTGPVTGYFGSLTAGGVKMFQGKHGIEQVGFVGPQTRAALNAE